MGLLTWDALGSLAVAIAIFLLLVDLMHRRTRWAARYPPGPMPMPGLGNLLQVDFHDLLCSVTQVRKVVGWGPHLAADSGWEAKSQAGPGAEPRRGRCDSAFVPGLKNGWGFPKLRSRFGDVFSLQLAWTPLVVINGLEAVREALVYRSEDTADRPPMPIYKHLGVGPHSEGVILARYGKEWREQRRFSVSTLRNFGLGKKSLEQWVAEEATCLCAAFADQAGSPFSPNALLNKAVSNVIASLIYGRRFKYKDPLLLKLLDLMEDALKEESGLKNQLLNSVPMLMHIPGMATKILPAQKAFMALLDELVTEHKMTRDPAQPPRDLTDAFLDEVEKAKGSTESSFNDANLRLVVADLFTAGMVTTSTTLAWALLLMILHPDVQRRVQQEIDEVIGQVRRPEMADQARMPFTMAVVHEVQRFGDIIPLGLPHMTSRDIEVQGFLIPKGTTLMLNLSSVLKDEKVWKKPFRFHPEHFLDAQGHFVKNSAFMPFSAGRRSCLGEPLARMELFLFFTCLLQRFSFSVPAGQPRPSDHGVFAFLVTPSPYQLCAVPR
ncbi:PREDICTED: cytochrome P450 2D14 isoform X2 [Hipposideros armiger]|uniref:Cytochrome P450 2D14 isoform X2 n=1 Tax=Hipposideros armiger TaxID=186990 RepID=A0A8B7PTJ1_HIPAR|nr:PREDICTED: cytochrome P450 2D14 isoform X2 [Hipposideros armiger]